MDPHALLEQLADQLWDVAKEAVEGLADPSGPLAGLQPLAATVNPALQGRLLDALSPPPVGSSLLALLREIVGDLPEGSALRCHGWEREPGVARGLALVLTSGSIQAAVALSPGPVIDLVVPAGANLSHGPTPGPWQLSATVSAPATWEASWRPGEVSAPAAGSASINLFRPAPVSLGNPSGPGVSWSGLSAGLAASPGGAVSATITLAQFRSALLPEELRALLGQGAPSSPSDVRVIVDRAGGLRFEDGGIRFGLPGQLALPGVEARGLALELGADDAGLYLRPQLTVVASLPALPLQLTLDGVGVNVPVKVDGTRIGIEPLDVRGRMPTGIGVDLELAPVSGGGFLRQERGSYEGILDVDLGVFRVQAMGILHLPGADGPLSFLALLTAGFPPPGIQIGFGFALDAVGGLLGINHRVDADRLRTLVSDGNADRVMFPENAIERANEILGSLAQSFPRAPGHHVTGPMLQLNWGGRLVRVSVAVLMEFPDPVRVIILGRAVIGIPDPELPLIRLQASLYGRIDPSVPLIEVLVSLTGSHVAGIPIAGEVYALFRGGRDAVFVLSAGGFHPRYVRPAGVPQLRRLSMDLGGGFLGLRGDAYLAITSNSMQFGALVHLDATIAGCGVEGHLGLDALFVWEPVIAFSVQVQAGVAVLAFGRRLASVGLRFTLEGPGAWHAFGTGSISVLWWDVELDFDVRWGTPPALTPRPPNIVDAVAAACLRQEAWALGPSVGARSPIRLTEAAALEVAKGELALPESGLRFSQEVVPLDIEFDRFHRGGVPRQTWRLERVAINPQNPVPPGNPVKARFVPGEFWNMPDDEQLSRSAFEEQTSGAELRDSTVTPGATRVADERYETGYEVDEAWFPQPPTLPRFVVAVPIFGIESFVRRLSAGERADVWRLAQLQHVGPPSVRLK